MSEIVLAATDLQMEYRTKDGRVRSLDSASLTVRAGQITAVVGESGSGKSTLGMAAGRLLASNAEHVGGQLEVAGTPVLQCDPRTLRDLRRNVLGFIFQNPIAALDPTMRIHRQLALTSDVPAEQALEEVGLRNIPRILRSYPHQLSGGMAQRVAIAMALSRGPRLLIADEPTASVDAALRSQILRLLVERCRAQGCTLLLLTHDLHAVAAYTSHIAVMYGGRVVENGRTDEVLADPTHPYTRALLSALPGKERPGQRLVAIPGVPPVLREPADGCSFAARCPEAMRKCLTIRPAHRPLAERIVCCHLASGDAEGDDTRLAGPPAEDRPPAAHVRDDEPSASTQVVVVRDVAMTYAGHGRGAEPVHALRGVSLDVRAGETVGVVGESGSGKTTLGRAILGLIRPTGGQVRFDGHPVTGRGAARRLRGRLQVVLQNPDWSLNPSLRIWRSIAEPLAITGSVGRRHRRAAVEEALALVGLDGSLAERHPHELSGGQRQRVAIARAIITRPELILFDEAVTALDVSVQTQILNLIRDLQAERGFAAVFISHDLAAVRYVSQRITVAYDGELVETGPVARFYGQTEHPYTQKLLANLSSPRTDH